MLPVRKVERRHVVVKPNLSEAGVHRQVCDYLRYTYPEVIFISDVGSGVKLTMGQAIKAKALRSRRGVPDLFVAEPRGAYHGLFIELKKEGATVYLKGGKLSTNSHIQEQAQMLQDLINRGYRACFAVGYKEATWVIDQYLKFPKVQPLSLPVESEW